MKKILIADDKPEVVKLVRATLEEGDYQIVDAFDGKEALEKIRLEKPALVLLDIIMPRMDGFEVLRQLKKNPQTKEIPIIMLTAKGQKLDKEKGIELGAQDYIVKPFSPSHLLHKIKEVLG